MQYVTLGIPRVRLTDRRHEHGACKVVDEAVGFGDPDEGVGEDESVLRMLPADQALDTGGDARGEVDLRLVVVHQFSVGDRLPYTVRRVRLSRTPQRPAGRSDRAQQGMQFRRCHRLMKRPEHVEIVGARQGERGPDDPPVFSAEQDDATAELQPRKVPEDLDPVHAGHLQVEEYDVHRCAFRLEERQRVERLLEPDHVREADLLELVRDHPTREALVVEEEDPHRNEIGWRDHDVLGFIQQHLQCGLREAKHTFELRE